MENFKKIPNPNPLERKALPRRNPKDERRRRRKWGADFEPKSNRSRSGEENSSSNFPDLIIMLKHFDVPLFLERRKVTRGLEIV